MQAQTESFSQTSDWFYESARSRPLLNKTQEQETDTAKWQALYAIFDLITKDPAGQSLLQSWANNLVNNKRTRHNDIQYHFIREAIQAGLVQLEHVDGTQNWSDPLTKAQSTLHIFKYFVNWIMMKIDIEF